MLKNAQVGRHCIYLHGVGALNTIFVYHLGRPHARSTVRCLVIEMYLIRSAYVA